MAPCMDAREHNRAAWDLLSRAGDRWSIPVSSEEVDAARRGDWKVVLTNSAHVPREWFPRDMHGVDVLALASGGGQQGPLFAAAGARVTVLDNSPEQLDKDRYVAERDGLHIRLVEGTMEDLSTFADGSFDLVFNPVSVIFTRDVRRVWREASRVLRVGGTLLAGMLNPINYVFDREALDERGEFLVRHRVPFADDRDLPAPKLQARVGRREPLEFGHTLTDLIGGQLDAGLDLVGFYEDVFGDAPLDDVHPGLFATRAEKRGLDVTRGVPPPADPRRERARGAGHGLHK